MAGKVRITSKARELSENEMQAAVQQAMDTVDEGCTPAKMTKQQAIDYYERIIDRCQTSVEVLEQEIENEA